jgi:hypothetical protein
MPILALQAIIPCKSNDNEDNVTISFDPVTDHFTIEQFQGTWFVLSKEDLLDAIRITTTGRA